MLKVRFDNVQQQTKPGYLKKHFTLKFENSFNVLFDMVIFVSHNTTIKGSHKS